MSKKDWSNVFSHYPDVDTIWVCAGQPFLKNGQAQAHSRSTGSTVEKVERPKPEADKSKAPATPKSKKSSSKK